MSLQFQSLGLSGRSGVHQRCFTALRLTTLHSRLKGRGVHDFAKNDNRRRWSTVNPVCSERREHETKNEDGYTKLKQAGYLRQAHSGIIHMLPLGVRVQGKVEALIDKHMSSIGASKISLSSISSPQLWEKSGRLKKSSELFRFRDRKGSQYLLAPTHEEEITALARSGLFHSYKLFPLKLYQISRKYRDELRPRQGLLRGREFVMKDLYTFDLTASNALKTYNQVKEAYIRLFDELKLPYLVAEADSGDMGGNLSHEFHFPTDKGEDEVFSCGSCGYAANGELAEAGVPPRSQEDEEICWVFSPSILTPASATAQFAKVSLWRGISKDRHTLVNVWYPSSAGEEVNARAVKAVLPDLDSGVEDPVGLWLRNVQKSNVDSKAVSTEEPPEFINIFDSRIPKSFQKEVFAGVDELNPLPRGTSFKSTVLMENMLQKPLHLTRVQAGDACPRCTDGQLEVYKTIELGHTFFLGTRYTAPFGFSISSPGQNGKIQSAELLEMGCHGIGVTRMIGAVAEVLGDSQGLMWPRALAPYEVIIIQYDSEKKNVSSDGVTPDMNLVYDIITQNGSNSIEAVLDDRRQTTPSKIRDVDFLGFPIFVFIGKAFRERKEVLVVCRQLAIRSAVHIDELREFVEKTLEKL